MLDERIVALADAALAGERLGAEALEGLFSLDALGADAAYVNWAARTITAHACGNAGQVYAQIGLDALACPGECAFCAFAASSCERDDTQAIVPLERVVSCARAFEAAGVHLISLMTTAAFPFELLLDYVTAVRDALRDDMPLLVNTGDLTLAQARALADAGVQAIYHARRIGEGELTAIAPQTRLATMRNARAAGLALMNAVEPVCADTSAHELLVRMQEAASLHPLCSGVGTLTNVAETPMRDIEPLPRVTARFYAAIMRLLIGEAVPFGCGGGNVVWADAGTNPRGHAAVLAPDELARRVTACAKRLSEGGWDVPRHPASCWFQ